MICRTAIAGDREKVGPLLAKSLRVHEEWDPQRYGVQPDALQQYARWFGKLAEDPRCTAIVAEDEQGRIVGFLVATVEKTPPHFRLGQFAMIHDICIEPEHRTPEVGQAMLECAAREFELFGVEQMRAAIAVSNVAAQQTLADCGFRACTINFLREIPAKPKRKPRKPKPATIAPPEPQPVKNK